MSSTRVGEQAPADSSGQQQPQQQQSLSSGPSTEAAAPAASPHQLVGRQELKFGLDENNNTNDDETEQANQLGARHDQFDCNEEDNETAKAAQAAKFRIRTSGQRVHLDSDRRLGPDGQPAGSSSAHRWRGNFHFIQAADCQFGMIDSYVHKRTEPGWREEIALCENLVKICNNMEPKPAFLVICGDLTDSLPASDIGQKQVLDFKRIFSKLDAKVPLVCVCGNHDVGDEPTPKTIADYRRTFGDDYFYFTRGDILFIVINSQFYQNRQQVQELAREQDQWLESMLERCKEFRYSFVFEHIPWFLAEPNEPDDYFNIRHEVRQHWLEKFLQAGVTKIMCGHYHRNAGGWYHGMEQVVTSAIGAQCGQDKSGIRIVKVYEQRIEHHYYAMEDIPLNIEL